MANTATKGTEHDGEQATPFYTYDAHPDHYVHWKLTFDGPLAMLTLMVDEDRGLKPGYKLKLNSYDLGVDIELSDALQRIRFEHPEARSVIVTSGRERIFCSGANIFMLGLSSHAWKVNFCKFTNETRNGIEDSSRYSGLKFVAACNGTTAGGGYELALACDEIILIDDRTFSRIRKSRYYFRDENRWRLGQRRWTGRRRKLCRLITCLVPAC
jgi:benzoyl-CoA-dihydrodiol lyase